MPKSWNKFPLKETKKEQITFFSQSYIPHCYQSTWATQQSPHLNVWQKPKIKQRPLLAKTLNWGNFHPFSSQASSAPKPRFNFNSTPYILPTPFRTPPHLYLSLSIILLSSQRDRDGATYRAGPKVRHILLYYTIVGGAGVKIDATGRRGGSFGNPMAT